MIVQARVFHCLSLTAVIAKRIFSNSHLRRKIASIFVHITIRDNVTWLADTWFQDKLDDNEALVYDDTINA